MSRFGAGGRREGSGERTAADRERARLERERRRAAREGRPLPPLPEEVEAEAAAAEPPVAADPPAADPPAADPPPRVPDPSPVEERPHVAPEPVVPAPRSADAAPQPPDPAPRPADAAPQPHDAAPQPPDPAPRPPDTAPRPADAAPQPPDAAPAGQPPPPVEPPGPLPPPAPLPPADSAPAPVAHVEPEPVAWQAPPEPPRRRGTGPTEAPAAEPYAEPDAERAPEPEPTQPIRTVDPPSPPPWRASERPHVPDPSRRTVKLPRSAHAQDTGEDDAPIGVKAVGGYETQPGAPGLPPNRAVTVQRRRRRGVKRLSLLALLLLLAAIAYGAVRLFQPFAGEPGDPVAVTIPEGSDAGDIGDILAERDVIDSAFLFSIRARIDGAQDLRSGPHELRRDMTYAAALAALREAPQAAATIDVTLPEGPSIRENADRVKEAGVRGDYVAAARGERARARARRLGLPRDARTLEGFLFPSTYELRRGATARQLVARQLDAYADQVGRLNLVTARRANLTRYDVLIIASMVEREALVPDERRTIAGVIYNRLREGIPLGIDATIRYDLGNWSRPLRVSELERDSPFNTRLNRGLPPTPIGNPGKAAIEAAANPREHDFLFYVVKPCGNGAHAFSKTDAEFQRDVAAYNRARDARGGRDPSRC